MKTFFYFIKQNVYLIKTRKVEFGNCSKMEKCKIQESSHLVVLSLEYIVLVNAFVYTDLLQIQLY